MGRTKRKLAESNQGSASSYKQKENGAVTAEFALVLPTVIVLLALLLGAAATGICQIKLNEASRLGARAAARGESQQTISRIVAEVDQEIRVQVEYRAESVAVTTSRQAPGIIGQISGWELSSQAVTPAEEEE